VRAESLVWLRPSFWTINHLHCATIKMDCTGTLVVNNGFNWNQIGITFVKPHSRPKDFVAYSVKLTILKSKKTWWAFVDIGGTSDTVSWGWISVLLSLCCTVLPWSLFVLPWWLSLPGASACLSASLAWLYLDGTSSYFATPLHCWRLTFFERPWFNKRKPKWYCKQVSVSLFVRNILTFLANERW